MRKLTRRETVVALLETYTDVILDGAGEGITSRADSRLLTLSKLYHEGSYKELERVLKLMHKQGYQKAVQDPETGKGVSLHVLHFHVSEWFLRAQRTTKDVKRTVPAKGGKKLTVWERKVITRRHPHVRERKVNLGVDWICSNWNQVNPQGRDPQLPKELLEVLAA